MTNTRQARKRQRQNKRRAKAEARAKAQAASARIAEDVELGRFGKLRMCTRKRSFDSELTAIHAAIRSSEIYGSPFRYYKCPHCGLWHLTSSEGISEESSGKGSAGNQPNNRAPHDLHEPALVGLSLSNRVEVLEFALDYLFMFLDASTDEELLTEGFRERCEELGFEMACEDRFARIHPENALYKTDALLEIVGDIRDPQLLGSAIFLHWRWATYWAEESLLSDENREWFVAALRKLVELSR